MTYDEYVSALQVLLLKQDPTGIANLNTILPRVIEYAELRIQRDPNLDFLSTRTSDLTQATTAGSRLVTLPSKFTVLENVALITPARTADPKTAGAKRVRLTRTTRDYIDTTWPQESQVSAPIPFESYWALFSQEEDPAEEGPSALPNNIVIMPTPDDQYQVEYLGIFKPTPLSEANPVTFITTFLPDLMISASMIFASGWERAFGEQSSDPQLAMSWETIYREQLRSAEVESARQKAQGADWSAYGPPPVANVPRTSAPPMQQGG
jgi:hypothetical protein